MKSKKWERPLAAVLWIWKDFMDEVILKELWVVHVANGGGAEGGKNSSDNVKRICKNVTCSETF